jgi:hypothetical protein
MSALRTGRASPRSRTQSVVMLLASLAALAWAAAPAFADDQLGAQMWTLALGLVFVVIPFSIATWFIEAAVLNYILELGYWRCFVYSLLANLATFFLGLIWAKALGEGGWKGAFMLGQLGRLALLFLRSFVVTVAEEGCIIVLLVGKQRDAKATLGAVLAANALTYAIGAPLIYAVRMALN